MKTNQKAIDVETLHESKDHESMHTLLPYSNLKKTQEVHGSVSSHRAWP